MAELRRSCELCKEEAYVYCLSDSAFLCRGCDEKVHCANFLVARHVRVRVCLECQTRVGNKILNVSGCCESCFKETDVEEVCLSSHSSCVSSTGEEGEVTSFSSTKNSSKRRRINRMVVVEDKKVEGILVNWCRIIGVEDIRVVDMTIELLTKQLGEMTVLPFRVSLAAAFWAAVRLCYGGRQLSGVSSCHCLKRLEQISGVPAKLIVATEPRLTRVIKRRQPREDHEEGWAEC